jgi:hypothetical protein
MPVITIESSEMRMTVAADARIAVEVRCGRLRRGHLHGLSDSDMMEAGRKLEGGRDMLSRRDSNEVLDSDFLETRCKILELAAMLDRIDRAPARHGEHPDPRLGQLRQALDALVEPGPGRAETVQRIFSLEYDPAWRQNMDVARSRHDHR